MKTRAKTKVKSRAKTKVKSRTKTKVKSRTKKQIRVKTKVKPRTKKQVRVKTKVKSRTKKQVRVKTKVKPRTKKQVRVKTKVKPRIKIKEKTKKQVKLSKKKLQQIKKIQRLAFRIDLRKVSKEQREYVKRIRQGYKDGEFKKKFTKYMLNGVVSYFKMYNADDVIKNLYKTIGVSKQTYNKLLGGHKVSKQTYKKFNHFLNTNFNSYELSFLFRIVDVLKQQGRISSTRIEKIVDELYEFLEPRSDFGGLSYYDYLHIYYD